MRTPSQDAIGGSDFFLFFKGSPTNVVNILLVVTVTGYIVRDPLTIVSCFGATPPEVIQVHLSLSWSFP